MKLETQWIIGFVDANGSFSISVRKSNNDHNKYNVLFEFSVTKSNHDINVLYALKSFFGCGLVRSIHGSKSIYYVRECKHLIKNIVPFFEKHTLKTKLNVNFKKFRKILNIVIKNDLLPNEQIETILKLKNQMISEQTKIESDCTRNSMD